MWGGPDRDDILLAALGMVKDYMPRFCKSESTESLERIIEESKQVVEELDSLKKSYSDLIESAKKQLKINKKKLKEDDEEED